MHKAIAVLTANSDGDDILDGVIAIGDSTDKRLDSQQIFGHYKRLVFHEQLGRVGVYPLVGGGRVSQGVTRNVAAHRQAAFVVRDGLLIRRV